MATVKKGTRTGANKPPPPAVQNRTPQKTPAGGVQHRQEKSTYAQKLLDYALLLEFKKLKSIPIPGVYVMPRTDNLRKWCGVIFLRTGKYRQGVFRFYLDLRTYPKTAPRIFFLTPVFNPLVNPTSGELDLSIQFPQWDNSIHFLALALAYLKSIFYNAAFWEPRSRHRPFNPRAAQLWKEDRRAFDEQCEASAMQSQKGLYDVHENGIRFSKPTHNHSLVLNRILRSEEELKDPDFSYASWFSDGVKNLVSYAPNRDEHLPDPEAELLKRASESDTDGQQDAKDARSTDFLDLPSADPNRLSDDEAFESEFPEDLIQSPEAESEPQHAEDAGMGDPSETDATAAQSIASTDEEDLP